MIGRRVLASLLLGGVILLASYMVAGWYRDGIFVGWQALGSPPGGPGEMVTGYMEPDREAAMSVIPVTTFCESSDLDDVTIASQSVGGLPILSSAGCVRCLQMAAIDPVV